MRNVAIVVETSLASGRQILAGISRFLHEHDNWTVFHQTGPLGALNPDALQSWTGDGIVARVANARIRRIVEAKRVPVVDVLGNVRGASFPKVGCDEEAISRTIADDLHDRGFRHFGFFGLRGEGWSEERWQGFRRECTANGALSCSPFLIRHDEKRAENWTRYIARLCQWLQARPRPLGLMIASDQFGPDVVEACRRSNLMVPEEVAIVGVDDDAPFCDVCVPRLSSVAPHHEKVGYEAAVLLDRMMSGEPAPKEPIRIKPLGLRIRRSSDAWALDDPALVKAMTYIRAHAYDGVAVDAIAQAAGLSRSVLQRRFQGAIGETVLDVITKVRLARAKEMLLNTNLAIADIAERSGFRHQEYLGYVFRRKTGQTPAAFRRTAKTAILG